MVEIVETKEKAVRPPLLYDLTALQRDANRILGFTAQQTLDYTQGLYEKKLVTYPRTDSRYLTEDMQPVIPELPARLKTPVRADSMQRANELMTNYRKTYLP